MSKRDLKKQQILDAGMEVMKARGYNGTSVKDIVDAAGVPKGSFYNYFPSKEAFAVEAIEWASAADMEELGVTLRSRRLPPAERLIDFFENQVSECCETDFRMGCFLGNMCQEMADSSELIRAKLRQVLKAHTQLLEEVLNEARDCGDLPGDTDTGVLAEFLFNAWEGAMMRMKAAKSREPLDAFINQLGLLLQARAVTA